MENITVEIVQDGNIEQCRALCDELMAFQKSQATLSPESFDFMNFDTRMKKGHLATFLYLEIILAESQIDHACRYSPQIINIYFPVDQC